MGCDIHLYVEKRVDGVWTSADKWTDEDDCGLDVSFEDRYFRDRNYEVFSILADVRNSEGYSTIAPPRWLPDDASPEVQAAWDAHGEHTPSWLTLAELLAFDWTQVASRSGWVNGVEFRRWNRWDREHGFGPRSYYGGVSGRMVRHVSVDEMVSLVSTTPAEDGDVAVADPLVSTYCLAEWREPYYRSARNFISECITKLLRLGDHDDVRIVFWFDS